MEILGKNGDESKEEISMKYGLDISTVKKIFQNREAIEKQFYKSPAMKKPRTCKYEVINNVLHMWFQSNSNLIITGDILKEKGKELARIHDIDGFTSSNGWLQKFKDRYNIKYKKFHGEAGKSDHLSASIWKNQVDDFLSDFLDKNILNLDETALFYKMCSNETLTSTQAQLTDIKKDKSSVTLLIENNILGYERKIIMVGKHLKPRCFKGKNISTNEYYNHKCLDE
uniref:HTH CENPB-type domain-containing protein n=1 Tax=Strongyloides venezuelensis TaxID=75913 RepID=A0A0K0FFG2_STRVS